MLENTVHEVFGADDLDDFPNQAKQKIKPGDHCHMLCLAL